MTGDINIDHPACLPASHDKYTFRKDNSVKAVDLISPFRSFQQVKSAKSLCFCLLILLFPVSSSPKRFTRPLGNCYDNDRRPQFCEPDFENVALKKKVVVSETCGVPRSESYCRLTGSTDHVTRVCDYCDRSGARSHPARHLTDINDNRNATYWQSRVIEDRRNVTLTISLGKKFEIRYISLQFYSPRPESMVIYKSDNGGRKWVPFQYYARNCMHSFGMPSYAALNHTGDREALCLEDSSDPLPLTGGRILFNPTRYRPSQSNFDNSRDLHEWITATDIKIVLVGVNDVSGVLPPLGSGFTKRGADERSAGSLYGSFEGRSRRTGNADVSGGYHRKGLRRSAPAHNGRSPPASVSQYAFGSSHFFAINDLTIGGRCKCNGHASRCIVKNGRPVCDCKHNTDGPNCERCKAFHFDHPWKSSTRTRPYQCVACNCNLHAKKCHFNADLFQKSGGESGGVCKRCRHHTTGRFCNNCKPGYYKNSKIKSIANRKICKSCGCHPVGAAGKICDPTTGQCPCKEGVAGKRCNRCAKGYQQTRSRIAPCIKYPTPHPPVNIRCVQCKKARFRLSLSRLCKYDYVIQASVIEHAHKGKWVHLTLEIVRDFKNSDLKRRKLIDVRVRNRTFSCFCPRLVNNRKYLLLGRHDTSGVLPKLIINRSTVALRWRNKYRRRLSTLMEKARHRPSCLAN